MGCVIDMSSSSLTIRTAILSFDSKPHQQRYCVLKGGAMTPRDQLPLSVDPLRLDPLPLDPLPVDPLDPRGHFPLDLFPTVGICILEALIVGVWILVSEG